MPDRSGERREEPRAPRGALDQLLDLTVYAPIGLLMSLEEVVPQLVEKGHQHVKVARFFGRMAVRTGSEEARRRFADATRRPSPGSEAVVVPLRPVPDPAPEAPEAGDSGTFVAPVAPVAPVEPAPPASSLGITDYDVLSASQVVPRLPGLSADELDAVRRYEAAHRGRKTILAKIAQLQA
jgi:hypothetical protein